MKIRELFEKPIDRPIEGVIKADDEARLLNEVEEYVITNEIAKHLNTFFDIYMGREVSEQGVWISGFFGSGKSHMLKMLSLLLEHRILEGKDLASIFIEKIDDELLKKDIQKAVDIPSKSILFNIDQQANVITTGQHDAILSTFLKVFNEMQGFYASQPYIAKFERDLQQQGLYGKFKEAFEKEAGKTWEKGRGNADGLENDTFAKVYAQVNNSTVEQGEKILDKYRETYNLSIDGFAKLVKEYIDTQEPGFRLLFFVDEIGQFIADSPKLMVNLQTISESFHSICEGKAWIIVTSQNDLSNVVGEMASVHTDTDFAKIQDRFPTRLALTGSNVGEVIKQRLLAKKPDASVSQELETLHRDEQANFKTLFEFTDGRKFRNYPDLEAFQGSYPFVDYHYDLFKSAIEGLSRHNAFTGRHASVGERSMLGVFQETIIKIADQEFGTLATYDSMYEGLRNVVRAELQSAIFVAENNLANPLAIRILKALFLVKYLQEFKGTVSDISVLLIDKFGMDISEHRKEVQEALNRLEEETYVQRMGDAYSFLTDEEKDIEEEIKSTELDESKVPELAARYIFDDLIGTTKYKYKNEHFYSFTRIFDEQRMGRENELGIHVVSPFNPNYEDQDLVVSRAMGKPEMLVFLGSDQRLYRELGLIARTEKYINQSNAQNQSDSRRRIIAEKGTELVKRKADVSLRIKELVANSRILVNSAEIQGLPSEPKGRIQAAFAHLVEAVYPSLRMLRVHFKEDSPARILNDDGDDLFREDETTLSEAESDILAYLKRKKHEGDRQTLSTLLQFFQSKPYGWYQAAIMANIAKLFMRSKVELVADSNTLVRSEVIQALTNNHHFGNTIIRPLEDIDTAQVVRFKNFHQEFFHEPNPGGTEARAVGEAFRDKLSGKINELQLILGKVSEFPFVKQLEEPLGRLKQWAGKEPGTYITEFNSFKDDWLDDQEDYFIPISEFVNGPQGGIFRTINEFCRANAENLSTFPEETTKLTSFLNDGKAYRGNLCKEARDQMEELEKILSKQLEEVREEARKKIRSKASEMESLEGFSSLEESEKEQLRKKSLDAIERIGQTQLIPVVRDTMNSYVGQGYEGQLQQFNEIIRKKSEQKEKPGQAYQYVTVHMIPNNFGKSTIDNTEDLDAYLNALRNAYTKELKSNKRISL